MINVILDAIEQVLGYLFPVAFMAWLIWNGFFWDPKKSTRNLIRRGLPRLEGLLDESAVDRAICPLPVNLSEKLPERAAFAGYIPEGVQLPKGFRSRSFYWNCLFFKGRWFVYLLVGDSPREAEVYGVEVYPASPEPDLVSW